MGMSSNEKNPREYQTTKKNFGCLEQQGKYEALELEFERAHRTLDSWGVPREVPDPEGGRPLELSLTGRLDLLAGEPEGE